MNSCLTVLIVGGDPCRCVGVPEGVEARRLGSCRDDGNGACRRALDCIRLGKVDCVVLMVSWLGHPASKRITAACKRAGVDVFRVSGGRSRVRSLLVRYVEEVRHG